MQRCTSNHFNKFNGVEWPLNSTQHGSNIFTTSAEMQGKTTQSAKHKMAQNFSFGSVSWQGKRTIVFFGGDVYTPQGNQSKAPGR